MMGLFRIKLPRGFIDVNVNNYFAKAQIPDIKKLFKTAQKYCNDEQRLELIHQLEESRNHWANWKDHRVYQPHPWTPRTEYQHSHLQDKLYKIITMLKSSQWGQANTNKSDTFPHWWYPGI